jgi:hypothetical protein
MAIDPAVYLKLMRAQLDGSAPGLGLTKNSVRTNMQTNTYSTTLRAEYGKTGPAVTKSADLITAGVAPPPPPIRALSGQGVQSSYAYGSKNLGPTSDWTSSGSAAIFDQVFDRSGRLVGGSRADINTNYLSYERAIGVHQRSPSDRSGGSMTWSPRGSVFGFDNSFGSGSYRQKGRTTR